ncbi:hypothetical protein [Dactylosporangium matsuzakiense]|uniref:hypothetical protein n=1 Tax=Dactylosporangium matsuzakiense TaxID=53360 RepID=UPI0021C3D87F|nr:hypothetical protein [Dactylosporangium matsuzakiense]UWZ48337.1 hypothetical protein Dmats_19165 [Dactylosporangium matsuzakiense]
MVSADLARTRVAAQLLAWGGLSVTSFASAGTEVPDLAEFVPALRRIDVGGGPRAKPGGRGGSLRVRDVGQWIAQPAEDYDPARLAAVWAATAMRPSGTSRRYGCARRSARS